MLISMHSVVDILRRKSGVIKLLFVFSIVLFLFLKKGSFTIKDIGNINIDGNRFYVKVYSPKHEGEDPKEVFVIIKRGKLRRRGGVFGGFISSERAKNVIYVVSILDEHIDDREKLIESIHHVIVDELRVKYKYTVVYAKSLDHVAGDFSEIVEGYCEKYKDSFVFRTVSITKKPFSVFDAVKNFSLFRNRDMVCASR